MSTEPDVWSELVSTLTPEEQSAVVEFIKFIRVQREKARVGSFLAAVDEFAAAHPDLLRRLAQ
jgi:hypothetical protein